MVEKKIIEEKEIKTVASKLYVKISKNKERDSLTELKIYVIDSEFTKNRFLCSKECNCYEVRKLENVFERYDYFFQITSEYIDFFSSVREAKEVLKKIVDIINEQDLVLKKRAEKKLEKETSENEDTQMSAFIKMNSEGYYVLKIYVDKSKFTTKRFLKRIEDDDTEYEYEIRELTKDNAIEEENQDTKTTNEYIEEFESFEEAKERLNDIFEEIKKQDEILEEIKNKR
ncbi:MAG: hypothetical protein QXG18_02710 [Candidatus Pacearchaeota archaeon]